MATKAKSALEKAEQELKAAKKQYNSAAATVYVKPDYDKKRQKANAAYAEKLRQVNQKKKEAQEQSRDALEQLKAAYSKKRTEAVYDSIDSGIQRSSIIKNELQGYDTQEKNARLTQQQKLQDEWADYDNLMKEYRQDYEEELYEIDQERQEWEQKDAQRKKKAQLKQIVDEKQEAYNQAVKAEKEAAAAQKEAEKSQKETADSKRPENLSDKNWRLAQQAYDYLKDMDRDKAVNYLKANTAMLEAQLSEQGCYWLYKQLGFIGSPYN